MCPAILALLYSFKFYVYFLAFSQFYKDLDKSLIVLNSAIYSIVYTAFLFGEKKNLLETIEQIFMALKLL